MIYFFLPQYNISEESYFLLKVKETVATDLVTKTAYLNLYL